MGGLRGKPEKSFRSRPSNSCQCGEMPFFKNFLAILDKSRELYFEKVRGVWTPHSLRNAIELEDTLILF